MGCKYGLPVIWPANDGEKTTLQPRWRWGGREYVGENVFEREADCDGNPSVAGRIKADRRLVYGQRWREQMGGQRR